MFRDFITGRRVAKVLSKKLSERDFKINELKRLASSSKQKVVELGEVVRSLELENERLIEVSEQYSHQVSTRDAEIEVLKTQVEDLLAWRQVELERMRAEATIYQIKRGRALSSSVVESGEDMPE